MRSGAISRFATHQMSAIGRMIISAIFSAANMSPMIAPAMLEASLTPTVRGPRGFPP